MTMRNDATRFRIDTRDRRPSRSVIARQGQVLLDADLDQEARLLLDRVEQETQDTLGPTGRLLVPAGSSAFNATLNAGVVEIEGGHGYLDGWLLTNDELCTLGPQAAGVTPGAQPHPRSDTVTAPVIVGIRSVVRYVDPVEEPRLADKALGDAQASGRALADWQVFPLTPSAAGALTCSSALADPGWLELVAASTGTLRVWAQTAPASTDPCSITPDGGYTRLENLLYRVEVAGGKKVSDLVDGPRYGLDGLKLKLSRRNSSVLAHIVAINGAEITVEPPALDTRNWFAPGLYAEIVSPHDDLDGTAAAKTGIQRLYRVAAASDTVITLQEPTPGDIAAIQAKLGDDTDRWYLRLWDATTDNVSLKAVSVPAGATESDEVDFGDGLRGRVGTKAGAAAAVFRLGDYWTFAARADGSIDWPQDENGAARDALPEGPVVKYAPLAVIDTNASHDCRVPFGTLSDQLLLYRGGDGQGVLPPTDGKPVPLPAPLRVAVAVGETPVANATVRWEFVEGGPAGTLDGSPLPYEESTGADGVSEVTWALDPSALTSVHRVQASLLVDGTPTSQPPIIFAATFNIASAVGYEPDDACLPDFAGVHDVAAALDVLVKHPCQQHGGGDRGATCCHTVGKAPNSDGEFPDVRTAIEALRKLGHAYICLCLLPGDHPLSRDDLDAALYKVNDSLVPVLELELGGTGANLRLKEQIEIRNLERVVLHDLLVTTTTSEALLFDGREGSALEVKLDNVTIRTDSGETGRALVDFRACVRVRVHDSGLSATDVPSGLRWFLPVKYASLIESVGTSEAPLLRERLGAITGISESRRAAYARDYDRAIALYKDKLDEPTIALLDAAIQPIRAGVLPSPVRMNKVVADWRKLVDVFRPERRGWPVAIAFSQILVRNGKAADGTDAVIEGCRIQGGITYGTPDRDLEAEVQADETLQGVDRPDGHGRLRLDGNVLGWLGLGSDVSRSIANGQTDVLGDFMLAESMVTRNTFTLAPQLHLSASAAVHGNVFEATEPVVEDQERIGRFVSVVASASGNLGPAEKAVLVLAGDAAVTSQAANARMTVRPAI